MRGSRTYFSAVFISFVLAVFLFSSCSTKKNTFTRRAYHNLTAHYNVYWNGMDNMRSGTKDFHNNIKDNYTTVLPVYNFGDKGGGAKAGQFAEVAIKKSQKTIQKHSMYFNRKEYNRWVDDAYLMMGKAYFYKRDYPMARRTFEYVIKSFNDNDIKYEAMLWQAMANMQLKDNTRAESMLDMVQNMIKQGKAPAKYEDLLSQFYAQYFIQQENYSAASEYLQRALELDPPTKLKTRINFILGQIYQRSGDCASAAKMYRQVLKKNSSFDMEFNAKINLAECTDIQSEQNREYIVKRLKKMLKDDKNKDYLDQVYYALGRISLRSGDTVAGLDYLEKSVAASTQNNYQKAISALDAADIFFARKNYTSAQAYYDSTMLFLPKDYKNYKEISEKAATLNDLVQNIEVIQRQDSLQRLASMSEGERNRIINNIIQKIREEEIRKQQEEMERRENQAFAMQNRQDQGLGKSPAGSGTAAGSWYFYNPSSMANGFTNFVRKWGRRKQEDNWFLSNKIMMTEITAQTEEGAGPGGGTDTISDSTNTPRITNAKDPKYYLQDIPDTPEEIKSSNDLIIQAYYNLGFIYSDRLKDYPNSIATFETLNQRFPENRYYVASSYQLYQIYASLENQPMMNEYRNLILTRYPETDFAKLLVNPDYYKEIQERSKEVNVLYEDTYRAFENQQYYMVINNAELARAKYSADTSMMPRFEYLRGMSLGKIEVVDSLVTSMQNIIKKYPNSEVRPLAQQVLDIVGRQQARPGEVTITDSLGAVKVVTPESKIYSYTPASIHFYVLILDNNIIDVEAIKVKISDFNTKYYDLMNLQVSSLLLEGSLEMITVNNFENAQKAVEYFFGIHDNRYVFTKIENTGAFNDFVISAENYPVFYRNKNVDQYLQFFRGNYDLKR